MFFFIKFGFSYLYNVLILIFLNYLRYKVLNVLYLDLDSWKIIYLVFVIVLIIFLFELYKLIVINGEML